RHTRTATDVLCVLTDSHRQAHTCCVCWRTPTDVLCVLNTQTTWAKNTQTVHGKGQHAESKDQRADMCTDGQPRTSYSPHGPKSLKQSTGRASVLSPRTSVLICLLMDSHRRPVCADGHTWTHTNVLCVLTDTHGRPVQPTWAKITQTVHGKGQRAESKDQRADMCTDGQPQTSCSTGRASVLSPRTNVLICVLRDSHGRPVCADGHTQTATDPTWAKITQTVHGKGQRAESKDQRADMCTDGQPRMSCVCRRTHTDVLCVLTDTHGRPVCADRHTRTHTDDLCPTWAKITQTVHGKGQRAESKDQRADMCTDGQPQTSYVLCVLNRQPTWDKITQTVHGKGQRAESKDQHSPRGPKSPKQSTGRASVQSPRTNVLIYGHTRTATDVLCVLVDTHGRPPRTSCVCWRTPTDVLCVLNRQPTWDKITQIVHGKGQR
ncbi:unnamed protein product, partial [Brassica rapa]